MLVLKVLKVLGSRSTGWLARGWAGTRIAPCSLFHTAGTASASVDHAHQFVVVGGGSGGLAIGSWLGRKFGDQKLAIIEPADTHFYQPMFTLVGAGAKSLEQTARSMGSLMPPQANWLQTSVTEFHPDDNYVVTADRKKVGYEYLVVALGLQLNFHKIKGLQDLLSDPASNVVSNYSPLYVKKTFEKIKSFQGGNAIFTMPPLPVKCPGAPQKIMYLAEDYWTKHGIRDKTNVMYNSALGVIFGVKKYANSLLKVVAERDIVLNFKRNLVEVTNKEAIFENMDLGTAETFEYAFLHASPPQGPLEFMKGQPICDEAGWVDVNKETLQHRKYPNIFGIGDCTNVPTSKTVAAVAAESAVIKKNLTAVMKGLSPEAEYDGYTSCPLITGYGKTILAEFDFNGMPLETFPIDQGKERVTMYYLKKDVMPRLYWEGLLKGVWGGPSLVRKILHLGTRE